MSRYAVRREAAHAWVEGGVFGQPGVGEHAAYMNELADAGFVLAGGPLAGTEAGRVRVLLIVEAESEAEIVRRLSEDPWERTERIRTSSIEPWTILVAAPHELPVT